MRHFDIFLTCARMKTFINMTDSASSLFAVCGRETA